jgi:hypothetical protein
LVQGDINNTPFVFSETRNCSAQPNKAYLSLTLTFTCWQENVTGKRYSRVFSRTRPNPNCVTRKRDGKAVLTRFISPTANLSRVPAGKSKGLRPDYSNYTGESSGPRNYSRKAYLKVDYITTKTKNDCDTYWSPSVRNNTWCSSHRKHASNTTITTHNPFFYGLVKQ